MARREMTVDRFLEIKRLIGLNQSDRQIARALRASRTKIAEIRRGDAVDPSKPKTFTDPMWSNEIDWKSVKEELGYKHPLKFIWEEKAQTKTTYSSFWKVFYKKFPYLRKAMSVPRDFNPGDRAEVDWAGGKAQWLDKRTGEIHDAVIFVGALGYSQLVFARAYENMKSRSFLDAHRHMYDFFGGVTIVTVPDCTKTAVSKCHIYDPDINPSYSDMAKYYQTTIAPARPYRPKDKALVELSVKLVMRMFNWMYRRHTFLSIAEINEALQAVITKINTKPHTRFKVSRQDMFDKFEKPKLKPLPSTPYESVEWREVLLHPDCLVIVEGNYYSAPHIYRGKTLRVRLSESLVELFLDGERLAAHVRSRCIGKRVIEKDHFPDNAKAYYEATPQNLISQSRFISDDLFELVTELFHKDTISYIRIVQGLIRKAKKHTNAVGKEQAQLHFSKAVTAMRAYNKIRVPYFQDLLTAYRKEMIKGEDREIKRRPGNPMLRYSDSNIQELSKTIANTLPPITGATNQGVL